MAEQNEMSSLDKRAAQLAAMPPQQLLGYIAALLEVSIRNQIDSSNDILKILAGGNAIPLKVEVENVLPIKVEAQIDDVFPVKVMIENASPIRVWVEQ